MTATVGIKLWSFTKVKGAIGDAAYNGTDSKYAYSDRVVGHLSVRGFQADFLQLDNIVICAVYSFFICYFHQMFLEYRRDARRSFV
jgi:hypothetical protein